MSISQQQHVTGFCFKWTPSNALLRVLHYVNVNCKSKAIPLR